MIIYGISEEQGVAHGATPFDPMPGEIRARIGSVLRAKCRPTPAFDVSTVDSTAAPGLVYLLLAVPRSLDAPHARMMTDKRSETWFQFPVRHDTITVFLSETELATRYLDRSRSLADRVKRLDTLVDAAHPQISRAESQVQFTFAAVPASPGEIAISEELGWKWSKSVISVEGAPRSYGVGAGLNSQRLRVIQGGIHLDTVEGWVELHFDGSVVAAHHMSEPNGGADLHRPAGDVVALDTEFLLVRIAALCTFAAEFSSEAAGASGDLLLRTRLTAVDQWDVPRPIAAYGKQFKGGPVVALAGDTTAMAVETAGMTGVGIHTEPVNGTVVGEWHRIGGGILQALGLAGPHVTTPSGQVRDRWTYPAANGIEMSADQ